MLIKKIKIIIRDSFLYNLICNMYFLSLYCLNQYLQSQQDLISIKLILFHCNTKTMQHELMQIKEYANVTRYRHVHPIRNQKSIKRYPLH